MAEKGGVSVPDEPTSSLPLADIERLLGLLDRLVAPGTSVIVITYYATAVELETVLRVQLTSLMTSAAQRGTASGIG
jgi:ABC-type sugar transport system ATPase subunit